MLLAAAVVIVRIAPPAPVEQLDERLISACTQGLRQGACVLSGESDAAQRSNLTADVRWADDFRVATVRVFRQGTTESEEMSGKIVFDDEDAIEDRWTTAGFTIATLVGDLTSWIDQELGAPATKEPPPSEPPPSEPPPPVAVEPPPRAQRKISFRSAGGFAFGQGLRDHTLRMGPWANLSYEPLDIPAALVLRGAVAWASTRNLSVRWSTVAVGMEARWPDDPRTLGFLLAADAGLSHVIASNQRTESRAAAAFSLFIGGEAALAGPLALVAGVRAEGGPITHFATSEDLVEDRRIKLGGSVGVLVRL